ncbi:MAG: hypothetical protein JST33_01590 [Actinobacteria bacterium]|nr:hypothetical protein [Actinomycetota bacterium]
MPSLLRGDHANPRLPARPSALASRVELGTGLLGARNLPTLDIVCDGPPRERLSFHLLRFGRLLPSVVRGDELEHAAAEARTALGSS